jgi:hypothetical protein
MDPLSGSMLLLSDVHGNEATALDPPMPRRAGRSVNLLSHKEHGVFEVWLLLGEHGATDRHDGGDDAVDALGALVLGRLEIAGRSWATATLAAIQRVTGLPPWASLRETISFSSSRVGAAMERKPWRNSTIVAPSSCRRSAMWVAFQGSWAISLT